MPIQIIKQTATNPADLDAYEPPNGMALFVDLLRQATPAEADGLLRLAFASAKATALLADVQRRNAAADLYVALKTILSVLPDNWGDAIHDGVLPAFHLIAEDVDAALLALQKAEGRS